MQAAGAVYFVEDEEIDFDRVIREEKIVLPKTVSWTAHWLAVEGVQPLIPENPPAIPREVDQPQPADASTNKVLPLPNGNGVFPLTPPSPGLPAAAKKQQQQLQQQQQLVKHVLSRELQLYYSRLTSSLLPPLPSEQAKRTAALASLRNDAGLQALLPYLIRWVGEGAVGALKEGGQSENDGRVLEVLMDVIGTLLENNTLFVEPYVSCCSPSLSQATSLKDPMGLDSCINCCHLFCLHCCIRLFRQRMRRTCGRLPRKRCPGY
jgi:transcription initiation factor TFIID subunit 6